MPQDIFASTPVGLLDIMLNRAQWMPSNDVPENAFTSACTSSKTSQRLPMSTHEDASASTRTSRASWTCAPSLRRLPRYALKRLMFLRKKTKLSSAKGWTRCSSSLAKSSWISASVNDKKIERKPPRDSTYLRTSGPLLYLYHLHLEMRDPGLIDVQHVKRRL